MRDKWETAHVHPGRTPFSPPGPALVSYHRMPDGRSVHSLRGDTALSSHRRCQAESASFQDSGAFLTVPAWEGEPEWTPGRLDEAQPPGRPELERPAQAEGLTFLSSSPRAAIPGSSTPSP